MLNKKNLGLGMMIAGGAIAIAGAILARKSIKENEEFDLELEEISLCEESDDVVLPEKEEAMSLSEREIELKKVVDIAYNTPTNWEPAPEEEIAVTAESTYNPKATPVSITQEELETVGNATF